MTIRETDKDQESNVQSKFTTTRAKAVGYAEYLSQDPDTWGYIAIALDIPNPDARCEASEAPEC